MRGLRITLATLGVFLVGVAGCKGRDVREETLRRQLASENIEDREAAIATVLQREADAVKSLEAYAQGNDTNLRRGAIDALGVLGAQKPQVAPSAGAALARTFAVVPPEERVRVIAALKDVGKPAVPPLISLAITGPENLQKDVLATVIRISRKTGVDELIRALQDESLAEARPRIVQSLRILTELNLGYDPKAHPELNREAIARWVKWWQEARDTFAEN